MVWERLYFSVTFSVVVLTLKRTKFMLRFCLTSQTFYAGEESLKHSVLLLCDTMSQTETWLNITVCYSVKEGREQT